MLVVVAALFAVFVWPTPWRWYQSEGMVFRINRFTGNLDGVNAYGRGRNGVWIDVTPTDRTAPGSAAR